MSDKLGFRGRLVGNVFWNWAGFGSGFLIAFFLSPFVVHRLGDSAFGLWSLVLSLTGYFGMLDLGLRSSVARYVSRHVALDDMDEASRTVSTAAVSMCAMSVTALCATGVLVLFLTDLFDVPSGLRADARLALAVVGFNVAASLPLLVIQGVLVATHRFDIINAVGISSNLLRTGLFVLVLKLGGGLLGLAAVHTVTNLAAHALSALLAFTSAKGLRLRLRYVRMSKLTEVSGYAIASFLMGLAIRIIYFTDNTVIGAMISVSAITYYTLAPGLIQQAQHFIGGISGVLQPVFASLDARNDVESMQKTLVMGNKFSMLVALPVCLGMMIFGRRFFVLWMGGGFERTGTVLAILAAGQLFVLGQNPASNMLFICGRHKLLTGLALLEAAVNLGLSVLLVRTTSLGIYGVALAAALPQLATSIFLVPLLSCRLVSLSGWEYVRRAMLQPVALGVAFVAGALGLVKLLPPETWGLFFAETVGLSACFAVIVMFSAVRPDQRREILWAPLNFLARKAQAASGQ